MIQAIGYLLIVLAVGHTATGIALYWPALKALIREGIFNRVLSHQDRRAAFWFLLFSAMLLMMGQLTLYASAQGDPHLLKLIGYHLIVIGLIGVVAMPKSPFWFALLSAPFLIFN